MINSYLNYYFYLIGPQHISLHFVDFKNKEKGRTKENERICKRSCWQNAITLFHLYYNKLDKLISGGGKRRQVSAGMVKIWSFGLDLMRESQVYLGV